METIIWNNLEKKGELSMLQFLQTGKVLYVLAAICALGVFSKLVTSSLYKRLIKETGNMALTKNKNLKTLKQKTENVFLINHGIRNTAAYIEKQIYGFRFMKMSLDGWDNLSMQAMILCFLTGGAAAFASYWYRCDSYYIALYGAMGILTGLFMVFVDNGANVASKRQQLADCLVDYVENSPHFYKNVDKAGENETGEKREKISPLGVSKPRVREILRGDKRGEKDVEEAAAAKEELSGSSVKNGKEDRTGRIQNEKENTGDDGGRNGKNQQDRQNHRFSVISRKKESRSGTPEPEPETVSEKSDELEQSIRYLQESLEQIAASRSSDREELLKTQNRAAQEHPKKTLHPEELKLLGEILQEYFS